MITYRTRRLIKFTGQLLSTLLSSYFLSIGENVNDRGNTDSVAQLNIFSFV